MSERDRVEAVANELLRQRNERGEDWPAHLYDFPHFGTMPGFREELQDQVMRDARQILNVADSFGDRP